MNYFSWLDTTNVIRARDKVKGTGKWQIDYLTPTLDPTLNPFCVIVSGELRFTGTGNCLARFLVELEKGY